MRGIWWSVALVAGAIALRLGFVAAFPTQPISDFGELIRFAQALQEQGLTSGGYWWKLFGPGLPVALAACFELFPGSPALVARLATVTWTGSLPALPLLLWRGAALARARWTAAALLAIWPGQIAFSGVVAQDNWVLVPTVALGCLAVRCSVRQGGMATAFSGGLLLATSAAFRQEMVVALLPLLVVLVVARGGGWRSRGVVAALGLAVPLLLLAAQRGAATGRFTPFSEHAGLAALGACVPGATINGWIDPLPHVASTAPQLLLDERSLVEAAAWLAREELVRRPGFHAARVVATLASQVARGEADNTAWSLHMPGVLAGSAAGRAERLARPIARTLRASSWLLLALGIASAIALLPARQPSALALLAAIVAKVAVHAAVVMQPRYLLAATALGILLVALASQLPLRSGRLGWALGVGAALAAAVHLAGPPALAAVQRHDPPSSPPFRFPLRSSGGGHALDCFLANGRLLALDASSATFAVALPDPRPGDSAALECRVLPTAAGLELRVEDAYAPGGYPLRIEQRLARDGVEVARHDVAAVPWSGWHRLRLDGAGSLGVEVVAVRPDPGPRWGDAARTTVRVAAVEEPPRSAPPLGRPAGRPAPSSVTHPAPAMGDKP